MGKQSSRGSGGVLFLEELSATQWHRSEWQDKCCVGPSPPSFGAGIPQCKQTQTPPPSYFSLLLPCPLPCPPYDGWPTLGVGGWTCVCLHVCVCVFRCECRPWSSMQKEVIQRGRQRASQSSLRGPWSLTMGPMHWGPPRQSVENNQEKEEKLKKKKDRERRTMVAEEVIITLSGGAPWGFRLQGGVEQQKPLQVAKVRQVTQQVGWKQSFNWLLDSGK